MQLSRHSFGRLLQHNKVVNGKLNLIDAHGDEIKGIRILDNSIIPEKLSTHDTCSTAMVIGTRGAQLIAEKWNRGHLTATYILLYYSQWHKRMCMSLVQ